MIFLRFGVALCGLFDEFAQDVRELIVIGDLAALINDFFNHRHDFAFPSSRRLPQSVIIDIITEYRYSRRMLVQTTHYIILLRDLWIIYRIIQRWPKVSRN